MIEIPNDPLEVMKQSLNQQVNTTVEGVSNLENEIDKMFVAVDAASTSKEPITKDGAILGSVEQVEQGVMDSFGELEDDDAEILMALMGKSVEMQSKMRQSVIDTLGDINRSSLSKEDKLKLFHKLADDLKNRTRTRFANTNLPDLLLNTVDRWLK